VYEKKIPSTCDSSQLHDADLARDARIGHWKRKAKAAAKAGHGRNLYVITLHPSVLDRREFRAANPHYTEGMPCVYVGLTIHDPGDRYEQHKAGYRSSKYAREFGVELALELIDGFDGSGLSDEEKEFALAEWLRAQGFAVWQN
jgi:predicted GIY-YIG superfamily endonuclease